MGLSILQSLSKALASALGDKNYGLAVDALKVRHAAEVLEWEKRMARGLPGLSSDSEASALEARRAAAALREVAKSFETNSSGIRNTSKRLREAAEATWRLRKAEQAVEKAAEICAGWARLEQVDADLSTGRAELRGLEILALKAQDPSQPDLSAETVTRLETLRVRIAKLQAERERLHERLVPKGPPEWSQSYIARVVGGSVVSPRVSTDDIKWFIAAPENLALLKKHCKFASNLRGLTDEGLRDLCLMRIAKSRDDHEAYYVAKARGIKRAEATKLLKDRRELEGGFEKLRTKRLDLQHKVALAKFYLDQGIDRLRKGEDPATTSMLDKQRERIVRAEKALQEFEAYAENHRKSIEFKLSEEKK